MHLTQVTSLRASIDAHADAIDLAHLFVSTIPSSDLGTLRFAHASTEDIIRHTAEKYERGIKNLRTDTVDRTEHIVIRDLDLPQVSSKNLGRIVAHAVFVFCSPGWFSRNKHTTDTSIKGDNSALFDHFTTEIYRMSETHMRLPCYMLAACSTLDTHLRNGLGSKLVQWIDPTLPVYLTASPTGALLYRKVGFHELDAFEIRLKDWGGSDVVHRQVMMVRRV